MFSSINSLASTSTSPVLGWTIGAAVKRPDDALGQSLAGVLGARRASIQMPWVVPQSSALMITSCATSTRRRVR